MYKSYEQDKADRKKEELDETVKWFVEEMTYSHDPDDLKEMLEDYLHELVDNNQKARESLDIAKKIKCYTHFRWYHEMIKERAGLWAIRKQPGGIITDDVVETVKWLLENYAALGEYRDVKGFLPEAELELLEFIKNHSARLILIAGGK